jgi:hypothetical protein
MTVRDLLDTVAFIVWVGATVFAFTTLPAWVGAVLLFAGIAYTVIWIQRASG